MKRHSEHSPIFQLDHSGDFVQIGSTSAFTSVDSSPYAGIKARALLLKKLLQSHGLQSTKSPTLTKFINYAVEMSDAWTEGEKDKVSLEHLLCAAQVERIANAALSMTHCDNPTSILEGLLNGSIGLLYIAP